jgi:hypothetical protein
LLRNIHTVSFEPGLILWYDLSNGKGHATGTWNVRSLHRAGSLTAATRELARYKLDSVGVQEVRWDKVDPVRIGDYSFFLWKRK